MQFNLNYKLVLVFAILTVAGSFMLPGITRASFDTSAYCPSNSSATIDYVLAAGAYPRTQLPSNGSGDGKVFNTQNVNVTTKSGDVILLSGYRIGADQPTDNYTDDAMDVTTNNGTFTHTYGNNCVAGGEAQYGVVTPFNITNLFSAGSNSVQLVFRDVCGSDIQNTPYYLNIVHCTPVCTANASQKCVGSTNLYNFDSCGTQGTLVQACQYGCANNACKSAPVTPTPTPTGFSARTTAASNILTSSATLNGYLNNLGDDPSADVWFQWGTTNSYGFETSHQTLQNAGPANQTISSLIPNSVYHFRIAAQNGTDGLVYGNDMSFVAGNTVLTSQVQTLPATSIQFNTAILNAQLLSLGGDSSATVYLQYGTTVNYGSQTPSQTMQITGPFSQTITGLTANTTYQYRAVAQTTAGVVYGSNMTFNTSMFGSTNLTISCFATPNPVLVNQPATFYCNTFGGNGIDSYEWSGACTGNAQNCVSTYANPGLEVENVLVTSAGQSKSQSITLMVNGFTKTCTDFSYEQCNGSSLFWYDSCGNQESLVQYCPNGCSNNMCLNYNNNNNNNVVPVNNSSVQTNATTSVNGTQATLNGYLYANNATACVNSVWFQWGTTTAYGYETSKLQQSNSGSFSQVASGLIPGNTYHYRAAAQDCSGNINYGGDVTIYTTPQVLGASSISTGLTNNFWLDSFILPLMITLLGIWMLRTGMFYGVEKWFDSKKKQRRNFVSGKELSNRIQLIKEVEKVK